MKDASSSAYQFFEDDPSAAEPPPRNVTRGRSRMVGAERWELATWYAQRQAEERIKKTFSLGRAFHRFLCCLRSCLAIPILGLVTFLATAICGAGVWISLVQTCLAAAEPTMIVPE